MRQVIEFIRRAKGFALIRLSPGVILVIPVPGPAKADRRPPVVHDVEAEAVDGVPIRRAS